MTRNTTLPTRRDEAWRYSDIAAVEAAWPLPAAEAILVPAGGDFARTIVQDSGTINQLDIAIGKGATAAQKVTTVYGAYTLPLMGVKGASITPALSFSKGGTGTDNQIAARVRINYAF